VDLELVDAASGRTVDRRGLSEDVRNLTGLQREPVRLVWEMLGFEATPAAVESLEDRLTNTLTACRAYVAGRGRLSMAGDEAELQAAVESLELAIKEDAAYVPARTALAQASARLFAETRNEQWKERAIAAAEEVIGQDDHAAEAYQVLGDVYGMTGERELELEAYGRATEHAGTAGPFIALGIAAGNAGEFEEAERALQTAINLRPDYPDSHHALGYFYCSMNRFDAAANEFRNAARAAPENPEAHINLGTVLYYQDQRQEAMSAFEDALALGPHPTAYSNLGTLYFEEGRFGDAAEMFEQAVALEGEELPAEQYYLVGNLASALYWSGDREAALASFELAIDLAESLLEADPDNHEVMAALAGYYGMVGRKDRGIDLLDVVTRQEIRDPYFMASIAEGYEDLGQRDLAVEWIGKALGNGLGVDWIERRPTFNELRNEPRFRELVQRSSNRG
jgi:tetratricopeptide (TPR) repeat protein